MVTLGKNGTFFSIHDLLNLADDTKPESNLKVQSNTGSRGAEKSEQDNWRSIERESKVWVGSEVNVERSKWFLPVLLSLCLKNSSQAH